MSISRACSSQSPSAVDKATEEIRHRYSDLQKRIAHHNELYHGQDQPAIPDAEYDALKQEAFDIERRHPELKTEQSVTEKVGAAPHKRFPTQRHAARMISLKNAFSAEQVRKFAKDLCDKLNVIHGPNKYDAKSVPLMVEPKLDGVALSLIYRHGELDTALTRGDGITGEVVTANAKVIENIPHFVRGFEPHESVIVRGETIIRREDFGPLREELLAEGKAAATSRNLAAGTLRQLDSAVVASRPLRFYAYRMPRPLPLGLKSQSGIIDFLREQGFETLPEDCRLCQGVDEAIAHYDDLVAREAMLPYDADGIVIKLDSIEDQVAVTKFEEESKPETLGGFPEGYLSGSDGPVWAVAYKFPAKSATAKLCAVSFQIGRTGVLTPVAELEPTLLEGVTVSRASMHNIAGIRRRDLRIGDVVELRRAGGVIPELVRTVLDKCPDDRAFIEMPKLCPSCQTTLTVTLSSKPSIHCPNHSQCPAQRVSGLIYFCSREAMDIAGAGTAFIETLVEKGYLKTPADIYLLHTRREELYQLEGYEKLSVDNAIAAIEASKEKPYSTLINALGIPNLGKLGAMRLAGKFPGMEELSKAVLGTRRLFVPGEHGKFAIGKLKGLANKMPESHRGHTLDQVADWLDDEEGGRDLKASKEAAQLRELDGDFSSMGELWEAISAYGKFRDLSISAIKMSDLYAYFSDSRYIEMIAQLRGLGLPMAAKAEEPGSQGEALSGEVVLVTGSFDEYPRSQVKEACARQGATISEQFTKKVTLLVCGDKPGALKVQRAEREGIKQWDKASFLERIPLD